MRWRGCWRGRESPGSCGAVEDEPSYGAKNVQNGPGRRVDVI